MIVESLESVSQASTPPEEGTFPGGDFLTS
jgi:hypothetical protein